MIKRGPSLSAIIISKSDSDISSGLKSVLDEMFYTEILPAITPPDLNASDLVSGHGLTEIEIAIALSHCMARGRAATLNSDWCLIVEEDAIINFTREEILCLIQNINSEYRTEEIPLGIHLFPEQFGILFRKKNNNFANVIYLPDFAVGYLLNSNAVKKSLECQNNWKIEVADWPKFIRAEIYWFSPLVSFILHPDFHLSSTLSATKVHRQIRANRIWVKKLFSLRNFPLFVIRIGHLFKIKFGNNPIDSEKIRSILVNL